MSGFIDRAVECIRNIVDIHRCGICDKSDGFRQRYACGHAVCVDCANGSQECIQCMTSSLIPCNKSVLDKQLSQKVDNISQLLNTFQQAFNIDVYRRQRISEQLKVEKEIFPECIQAPMKYCNKRKSLNISFNNKENKKPIYKDTSFKKRSKMDKAMYIEKWLNDSKTRIPFSDLNVNDQSITNKQNKLFDNKSRKNKSQSPIKKTKVYHRTTTNQTKNQFKQNENQSNKNFFIEKCNKTKVENDIFDKVESQVKNKYILNESKKPNDINESGIVLEDDYILIDDTPLVIIDKDELALQAVLEADRQAQSDYVSMLKTDSDNDQNDNNESKIVYKSEQLNYPKLVVKVPFYKKGLFYKTCRACKHDIKVNENKNDSVQKINNISVTIDNEKFITNLKVYKVTDAKVIKKDISVQTDINSVLSSKNDMGLHNVDNKILKKKSQDLFIDEANIHHSATNESEVALSKEKSNYVDQNRSKTISHEKKSLVIEESDSDLDVSAEQISMNVTAEIHRSCEPEDYGILTEIPHNELPVRKRRAERGLTPTSTDSSEKENYDPNRNKKPKYGKKKFKKPN